MNNILLPGEIVSLQNSSQTRINYRKDTCHKINEKTFLILTPSSVKSTVNSTAILEEDTPESDQIQLNYLGEVYSPRPHDNVIGIITKKYACKIFYIFKLFI